MKIPKKYKERLKKYEEKKKMNKEQNDKQEEEVKAPSLIKQAKKFSVDAIKHAVKGNPTCTQEQINERLKICESCKWFRSNRCMKCGCACNKNKKYLNKLAWADQSCPVGKWGPIEENEEESS